LQIVANLLRQGMKFRIEPAAAEETEFTPHPA
jgi:hypothetical protein